MLLGQLGATIIKVEDTERGDYSRQTTQNVFKLLNRGKKSVAINLKNDAGREVFYKLIKNSDVVLEGFRPGIAERLGVDYATLTKINPRIVYCSISGYGQSGEYREQAGHDLNYVAMSGLLSPELSESNPGVLPVPLADTGGALVALVGILAKLLDGSGGYIDVSLAEASLFFNLSNFARLLEDGKIIQDQVRVRSKLRLNGFNPSYNIYKCSNGYITIAASEARFWKNTCEALGRPDLEDKQSDGLAAENLRKLFSGMTTEMAADILLRYDVPVFPVRSLDEVLLDKTLSQRGFDLEDGSTSPFLIDNLRPASNGPVPNHGEHTKEILIELGTQMIR